MAASRNAQRTAKGHKTQARALTSMQAAAVKEKWTSLTTAELADEVEQMHTAGSCGPDCNISPHLPYWMRAIALAKEEWHPIQMIRGKIQEAVKKRKPDLEVVERPAPVVTIDQNFNELLIPSDHPARGPTDTYYLNNDLVLRTQMTAHHTQLLRLAAKKLDEGSDMSTMLCTGEVYRKDTIDATHLPVHHQLEGISLWEKGKGPDAIQDLKDTLEAVVRSLYGEDSEIRWRDHELTYVEPGLELDVKVGDDWLELLGCGALEQDILKNLGLTNHDGWAWGLGLERLAMRRWGVPDIRWLWSSDSRWIDQCKQWQEGGNEPCVGWSQFPPVFKDVTLRLSLGEGPQAVIEYGDDGEVERAGPNYHINDFMELVRDVAGERVGAIHEMIDKQYQKPNSDLFCISYRITYRHMERTLTNEEVDEMQASVRDKLEKDLGLVLG